MDRKQWQHAVGSEQCVAELLPRNLNCSHEGAPCGCRSPNMTFQPQWVTARPCSLCKTFLVCLLACLIATTLVVVVLYFVHFGKPTSGTTIITHGDGKSSNVTCIPGSSQSPNLSLPPGSQSTLPSNPVADQSSPTPVPPSTSMTTRTTTVEHEVIIEDGE